MPILIFVCRRFIAHKFPIIFAVSPVGFFALILGPTMAVCECVGKTNGNSSVECRIVAFSDACALGGGISDELQRFPPKPPDGGHQGIIWRRFVYLCYQFLSRGIRDQDPGTTARSFPFGLSVKCPPIGWNPKGVGDSGFPPHIVF